MSRVKLRLTGRQHDAIRRYLLPGDGLEAVALALCGRRRGEGEHVLTVRKVVFVPYDHCDRGPTRVRWATDILVPLVEEAGRHHMAILKMHSHPHGGRRFSPVDDVSDTEIFTSVFTWIETDAPHVSAIMLPDGELYGRAIMGPGKFAPLACVGVAGDDLRFWYSDDDDDPVPEFARRHAQLFGVGTTARLRRLCVGVVGCSGTGSVVIELLGRLGVGRLVLVDPDRVEERNLNRIMNATREDVDLGRYKVDVAARSVAQIGTGTEVTAISENLIMREAVEMIAGCDVVFGCMDTAEGRHILNKVASFYLIPYFDVGVRLDADGAGGIDQVCGAVHALQPDGSSLLSRRVYTMARVEAEGLRRTNPKLYRQQVEEGYLHGVDEERPAVVSVNAFFAAMAVNEFLARLHPYRYDDNREFAVMRASLIQGEVYRETESEPCPIISRHAGRGDVEPLLEMPELSE